MYAFEIVSARKAFGSNEVLKDITVRVERGTVTSIIGPSGSGKSTLLRCATMLERLDGGDICYNGEYLAKTGSDGASVYAPAAKLREIKRYYGLVFQNFNLFPHYSVLKNITDAPVRVQKQPKSEAVEKAMGLLHKMGLEDKADAYPYQLSGGQQQRVSIARALAMDPEMLFFDEPTSALDPELTGDILKVIRGLAAEHMTMVVVTHEMAFARDVSDHVVFMDGGSIIEEGKAGDVISNPQNARTQSFLSRFSNNSL